MNKPQWEIIDDMNPADTEKVAALFNTHLTGDVPPDQDTWQIFKVYTVFCAKHPNSKVDFTFGIWSDFVDKIERHFKGENND